MGMDVYGKNASADVGEYFRNNVWWWRPLWQFCDIAAPSICSQVKNAQTNDGDGLDAEDATELAVILEGLIESGAVEEYEILRNEELARLPRHECKYCGGTGVRRDRVGVDMGMPTQALEPAIAIITGRTHGTCNACRGEGMIDDIETSYAFSVENVADFAIFLRHSGGFSIC